MCQEIVRFFTKENNGQVPDEMHMAVQDTALPKEMLSDIQLHQAEFMRWTAV